MVLFIRDAEKTMLANYERYANFKRNLDKLSGRVVVLGMPLAAPSRARETSRME
jgi:hypothetical protein